jgi:hypothetical protein
MDRGSLMLVLTDQDGMDASLSRQESYSLMVCCSFQTCCGKVDLAVVDHPGQARGIVCQLHGFH